MTRSHRVRFLALTVALAACGGANKDAKAPASPEAPAGYPAEQTQAPPADAMPTAAPPPVPGAAATPESTGDASSSRSAAYRNARADFDRAARELDATRGNCESACRALGSMDRAAQHLCTLAEAHGTDCEDARARVKAARERVTAACGSCADTKPR
jgi:hypothetical protein